MRKKIILLFVLAAMAVNLSSCFVAWNSGYGYGHMYHGYHNYRVYHGHRPHYGHHGYHGHHGHGGHR